MVATRTTDVLIVGAGPTGLCASLLLSQQGIDHVLIERGEDVLQAPAAHVINTRTMEIFAQLGLPVEELYGLNRHPHAHKISWLATLQSPVLGEFDLLANPQSLAQMMASSNQHTTNISQHMLEQYLLEKARSFECADIRYGARWLGFVDDAMLVSAVAQSSDQANLHVHAKYLLAADGASSAVAKALNIRRAGPEAIATFINFSCAVDINKAVGGDDTGQPVNPNLLLWLLDPDLMGTVIVHDPKQLSVFMKLVSDDTTSADDYDDKETQALLSKVFGTYFQLQHKSLWRMTAQVAERFRHQHVFLVGDSAHRFPPTGGLGLNTGVGDVHNLVWKLAACLRDPQQQPLLETYEQERRPIALRSTDVSVNNNRKMEEVLFALGLDPSKAQLLQKIMSSALIRAMPKSAQKRIRAILVAPVRRRLALAAEDGSQGQAIRERTAKAIDDQEEHFNTIGLQLGSVYEPNVAIRASTEQMRQAEISTYNPVACIGARLPHVALTPATDVTSTLDLLDYSRYTVLVNGLAEFDHHKLQTFGQAIKVLRLDDDLLLADRKTIEAAYELGAGEWLLVRPDGIIADRSAATVQLTN